MQCLSRATHTLILVLFHILAIELTRNQCAAHTHAHYGHMPGCTAYTAFVTIMFVGGEYMFGCSIGGVTKEVTNRTAC